MSAQSLDCLFVLYVMSELVTPARIRTQGLKISLMLAHVVNSLLCLSQLCHSGLQDVKLFFWDCFFVALQLVERVVAPCCHAGVFIFYFFASFELEEHGNVAANIMSGVLL